MDNFDYEKFEEKQEEQIQLKNAIFGTRIINNDVVEKLLNEIYAHYHSIGDSETTKSMEKYKKITLRNCGEICALLYQIKYWHDVQCRTNKKKRTFYKIDKEFNAELCWINKTKLNKTYLPLITDMKIISRKKGLRGNPNKYTYLLNIEHPLVEWMYLIDAMSKYHNKYGKDDETVKIMMQDMKESDFYSMIENKAVKQHFEAKKARDVKVTSRLSQGHLTVRLTSLNGEVNVTSPTAKTTAKTKSKNKQELERNNSSAKQQDNISLQDENNIESDNNLSSDKETIGDSSFFPKRTIVCPDSSVSKLNGDSAILKTIQGKWEKLSDKRKQDIEKLNIKLWRKSMKKAYVYHGEAENNPYDKSENWFNGLNDADRKFIESFQKEMYPPTANIEKAKSYRISLIDAHTIQDNFLQFCKQKELV